MKFKTELHCHSSPISGCSSSTPEVVIEEFKNAEYSTIVLTNHLSRWFVKSSGGNWEDAVDRFVGGYEEMIRVAGDDINILLGAEITLSGSSNDYLVYGITKEFLLSNPDITNISIKDLSKLCRDNGFSIYQAHPFRRNMSIVMPSLLDGLEIDNGNIRHNSSNPIAKMWAERFSMAQITGSDYHDPKDLIACGIETDFEITTNEELLTVLKSGQYTLLYSGLE